MNYSQAITGVPMDMTLHWISKYIFEKKGIHVRPLAPKTASEIESFEKIIMVVTAYYNIEL